MRPPTPSSVLPKVIVFMIVLIALYHVRYSVRKSWTEAGGASTRTYSSDWSHAVAQMSPPHIKEAYHQAPLPPGRLQRNSTSSPIPLPSHEEPTIPHSYVTVPDSFDHSKNFLSYGQENCFPSFNKTMQNLAADRHRSCSKSAPFPLEEQHKVVFATASTGGALSLAYEGAIHSQMTHSTIHNTTVHMLCAELTPGNWNKIAFLLHLITNELLKPAPERLDWILWIDRDTLILDQCRPLSSFLPPKSPEYEPIHLVTNNDAFGLNAGVFFFRPTHWALQFFTAVQAYRYYRPTDLLRFAEQSGMERIMASSPDLLAHTVRVPWYWFNAYPPEGGSTKALVGGAAAATAAGMEWFRARKGDFIAHFAGHHGREVEMLAWREALGKMGDVWRDKEGVRDITGDVRNYWRAWRDGLLTDGMRSGEPV